MAETRYATLERFLPCLACGNLGLAAGFPDDASGRRKVICEGCGKFYAFQLPLKPPRKQDAATPHHRGKARA